MSKEDLLQQYKNDVTNLRKCAKALNLSDSEIDQIFEECFQEELSSTNNTHKYFSIILKTLLALTLVLIFLYILLNVHQPTSSIVLRNVQGLIYPGLKLLRFFAAPIVEKYPSLTALYDESCLIENPYFYVSDMECWPCENVHSVIDLTGFSNQSLYNTGIPYIVKTNQKEIHFEDLKTLYLKNQNELDSEADHIKSNNFSITNLHELFEHGATSSTHIIWRMNKMLPGRLIRRFFPRPQVISEWSGQSIERFVMIDAPKAGPYILPNPECSYVILTQATGQRTIILKPSKECGDACKTVSVILKPSHILWYNWWYWRPLSLPVENATGTSITYITSYC